MFFQRAVQLQCPYLLYTTHLKFGLNHQCLDLKGRYIIVCQSISILYVQTVLRFTKEEKAKRHPLAHMPFGWGPRSCIASRLALIEAKMALVAIMKEYKFVEAPDTEKVSLSII